jgi:hypothetical protein
MDDAALEFDRLLRLMENLMPQYDVLFGRVIEACLDTHTRMKRIEGKDFEESDCYTTLEAMKVAIDLRLQNHAARLRKREEVS